MISMVIFAVGLVLDFVAFAALQEDRDRKWYKYVWLTFISLAVVGCLLLLYALLSASNVPSGEAGGFMGLGLLILAFICSPYLVLLLLCLKYRPQRGKE
jgi:hypothetical protein